MKNQFIKVQLFGDPAGDPNAQANGSTDPMAQTPGAGGDAPNAAAELLEFKKKYVPVEKYEAERNRADGYLAAIMNNRENEIVAREGGDNEVDADALAKEMFVHDNQMTDLEYCENALKLRNARLAAGEVDPFLPNDPDEQDVEIANNVADVFEQCIKAADGNNAAFVAMLQSRIKETSGLPKNFIRR